MTTVYMLMRRNEGKACKVHPISLVLPFYYIYMSEIELDLLYPFSSDDIHH